jgi:ornithine cyclodeaminase
MKPPAASWVMGLMPAHIAGKEPALGLKAICVFPGNVAKGKDAHQGSVMLFSNETGELLALMNASAITAIRTAAASAVATRVLAREDAHRLAIIGGGVQGRSHLEAMACVRPIRHASVVCRTFEHAKKFAQEMSGQHDFPIEPVTTAEAAVREADLIVTATTAAEPVVRRDWLRSGVHINAVGACFPNKRELDGATMAAASVFVDRRESALNEAGDYVLAVREGAIGAEHIRAEIGEVVAGTKPGRASPQEITIFKSLGIAVEDVATADYLYQRAKAKRIGTWTEL